MQEMQVSEEGSIQETDKKIEPKNRETWSGRFDFFLTALGYNIFLMMR